MLRRLAWEDSKEFVYDWLDVGHLNTVVLLVDTGTVWTQKYAVVNAYVNILQLFKLFLAELPKTSLH